METAKTESSTRVIFFDNLRYLFVLCVVLQHSGSAYSGFFARWWSVWESNSSMIVFFLQAFFDTFTMPLLFYIAGYFAVPTIQRHGISSFIKGKLKRLGIPWIVCILTVCPVYPLIYHYTRDNMTFSTSYLDLWINQIKNAAQFTIGFFTRDTIVVNDGFFLRYMWFISLLLLFFFIFSIIYHAKKKWFDTSYPVNTETPSISSTLKLLGTVGLLSLICSMITYSIMIISNVNPLAWFTLGNVIQFQSIRLFAFIIYFGLGVMTYKNKWIERGRFPGHLKTWMISLIILLIVYMFPINFFYNNPVIVRSKAMVIYGLMSFIVQNLLTIATLGFFSSLAIRYWNKPRRMDRSFASVSYDIYLSHYLFVVVFQLILFTIPGILPLIKFIIVSASSIICAYIVSRFLIKPFPKVTVALSFMMLFVMFATIKP